MALLSASDMAARFPLDGLTFRDSSVGPIVCIDTTACRAEVALYGAHLLSFLPRGHEEVIFLSRSAILAQGTPIRGGIPVCWPWFGAHPENAEAYSHGYARRMPFALTRCQPLAGDGMELQFDLRMPPTAQPFFETPCAAHLTMALGRTLSLSLVTHNEGSSPLVISEALHSYFHVGDVRQVIVAGLQGHSYRDDVDGGARKQQVDEVRIVGEVDRVYGNVVAPVVIEDPSLARRIRVRSTGSSEAVVWNPGPDLAAKMKDMEDDGHLRMLCVETANVLDCPTIPPGATHQMTQHVEVEAL